MPPRPDEQTDIDEVECAAQKPDADDEQRVVDESEQDGRRESSDPLCDSDEQRLSTWPTTRNEHRDEQTGHAQVLEEGAVLGLLHVYRECHEEQPLDQERRDDDDDATRDEQGPRDNA